MTRAGAAERRRGLRNSGPKSEEGAAWAPGALGRAGGAAVVLSDPGGLARSSLSSQPHHLASHFVVAPGLHE